MASFQASPRAVSILKWTGVGLAIFLIAVLVVASLVDLKRPIERLASARLHRPVEITGQLEVHPWSWSPTLKAAGVRIGNAPWDARAHEQMADIKSIELQMKLLPLLKGDLILPYVKVDAPQVYAHRDASGHANWDFGSQEKPAKRRADPVKLPVVQNLTVDNGKLEIHDDVRKLVFRGTLRAREGAARAEGEPFLLEGKGELNGRTFNAKATGGSLIGLDAGDPYPFNLDVDAADIKVKAKGVVPKPFDMGKLRVNFRASGNDMADLYYLTGLAIPNTPPYDIAAAVERSGAKFHVTDIDGAFGKSDVHGTLDIDTAAERPKVSGRLESKVLDVKDVTAMWGTREDPKTSPTGTAEPGLPQATGKTAQSATVTPPPAAETAQASPETATAAADAGQATDATPEAGAATAQTEAATPDSVTDGEARDATPPQRVFPDARLQVNRVRGTDADIEYTAETVNAGNTPVKELSAHVSLDAGLLKVDPFTITFPDGKVAGSAHIDARRDVPRTELDVRMGDIDLEQFKRATDETPPLAGLMQARAVMHGDGASVHEFVSHASGTLTAVVPHGEVRAALAELTGINVLRGVGLLITDDQKRAEVRCGVANFEIEDGVMRAEHVVFDTEDVLITGSGEIRFGPEELDLALKGNPKEFRLVRLDAPIEVDGHLRDPNLHVGVEGAAKQIGVGVALSAIIAPIAALFAFVDGGLEKDANCAALLASAQETEAPPPASASDVEEPRGSGT
jgi:uncharacterized protein involved in outer membrane biogenesis